MALIIVDETPVTTPPLIPTTSVSGANLVLKNSFTSLLYASDAAFFNLFYKSSLELENTERQTVVNIESGVSGVLTHVVGSATIGGTCIMYVTVDGIGYVYNFVLSSGERPVLGGMRNVLANKSTSDVSNNYLEYNDSGWSDNFISLLSPQQTVTEGFGIPFLNSLKVELQYSRDLSFNYSGDLAGVMYVER